MIYAVSELYGVRFGSDHWALYYRDFFRKTSWHQLVLYEGSEYAMDYAALRLKDAEAFIVFLSDVTGHPMESFSEKSVRRIIKKVNEMWELV